MTAYIALLRKHPDTDFGVDFPDFPGCVTAGISLEEARHMAAEALRLHVEGMIEDGTPLPRPSTLDDIMLDAHHAESVAFLVDAPARAARSVRVNVMMPEDLLHAIDRVTNNRSRYLAAAAREKLSSQQ